MKMIIDANALIDYGEGVGKKFFADAIKKEHDIYVPEEIYAEARYISPSFHEIRSLVSDLLKHGIYHPIRASAEDRANANDLSRKCYAYLGFDLDRTDRLILAMAKKLSLTIVTADPDIKKVAVKMGLSVSRHKS